MPRDCHLISAENPVFVDPNGLDEQMMSTRLPHHHNNFRRDIMVRDGEYCVVTHEDKEECQATHIIPRGKGDDYLQLVLRDRSHCYDDTTSISNINDVRNGIFLSMNMHSKFVHGTVAFLKVPNFALDASDIAFVRQNNDPACIVLHCLKYQPLPRDLVGRDTFGVVGPSRPHAQVVFDGAGHPQPPAIILDFMYGVAAYKHWKPKGKGSTVVETYKQHYASCLKGRHHNPPQNDRNDDGSPADYEPSDQSSFGEKEQDTLIEAMDEMNFLLMYLSGISPEEAAMRKIKREEEEKCLAQEASRSKVTEWMKTVDVMK
ncbi:hypothetical protein APHAL10511_003213 [Amanita phalloides]|nr:hypothetical protein APHAL10511_003213 [Amanita phalloides]